MAQYFDVVDAGWGWVTLFRGCLGVLPGLPLRSVPPGFPAGLFEAHASLFLPGRSATSVIICCSAGRQTQPSSAVWGEFLHENFLVRFSRLPVDYDLAGWH